jgi:hypothetical protein
MRNSQKFQLHHRIVRMFSIALLLFAASPNYAVAYGGYGYGYGHHGYSHYGHHGYSAHYSHHGHIGTAGYVFLGILGVAILSQVLDNDNDRDRRYQRSRSYNQPPTQPRQVSIDNKSKSKPVFSYGVNEGWDSLAKGNANYALDIFAIQSQQNLNSGVPKVGFAIAAASNGDTDRATRAMRKAIRIDANALDKININNIKPTIATLFEKYKLGLDTNNNDDAFMIATLSYLQQDYATANNIISENDHSQSANNLRELLVEKDNS